MISFIDHSSPAMTSRYSPGDGWRKIGNDDIGIDEKATGWLNNGMYVGMVTESASPASP